MGSGVSAEFSAQEKETITSKLKHLYAELKTSDNSDNEIQNKLLEEYQRLTDTFQHHRHPHSPSHNGHNDSPMKSPHHLAPTHASVLKLHAPVPHAKSNDSGDSAPPTTSSITPTNAAGSAPNSTRRGGGGRTRRRSFDVDSKNRRPRETAAGNVTKLVETSDVLVSKSAANLPNTTDIAVDSWDSVTQQPFCEICKMAFKSAAFLERHVKYSNLHTENVKRLQDGDQSVVETHTATVLTQDHMKNTKQEEGIHYRLLYSGSKFYWRCQQSIDLDIYHHFLPNTIEIVPFHANKQKELPRIYLDYELVLHQVNDSIKEEVINRKNLLLSDKFTAPTEIDETKLRLEVTLIKVVTFVLQRITYDPKLPTLVNQISSLNQSLASGANDGNNASESLKALNNTILAVAGVGGASSGSFSTGEDACGFMALFGDDVKQFPVLQEPPVILVPLHVNRRRRSTAEEFDSEMRSVDKDQTIIKANIEKAQELTRANARAEKIANFVYLAAQIIKEKKYRYSNVTNRYQRLWLWSIHRIIHQNNVLKNRANITQRGLNFLPKSPYKPVRIRDQEIHLNNNEGHDDPTVAAINNLTQE